MKRIIRFLPLALCILVSCNPESGNVTSYISYNSNSADFSILNLSTGEMFHNGGIVTHVDPETDSIWVSPNNINASYNDTLKVIYQSPQKYANSNFRVTFKGSKSNLGATSSSNWSWNHNYYGKTPCEKEIIITQGLGAYIINCDAKADEWMEGSSDYGIVQITVLEDE